MNETPKRPTNTNNGSRTHFSPERLAPTRIPGKNGAAGGSNWQSAPASSEIQEENGDELQSASPVKPPVNLLRRPIPVSSSTERPSTISRPNAQNQPLSARAQPPSHIPNTAPANAKIPAPAPSTVNLPPGIKRGFSRPELERPAPIPPAGRGVPIPEPVYEPVREKEDETVPQSSAKTEPPLPPETSAGPDPEPEISAFRPSTPQSADPEQLEQVLYRLESPPVQTALLGVCEDGLPLLFDLSDDVPGALLVASDDEILRHRLLRTLLQSASALNSPRNVQVILLSSRPAEWRRWLDGQDVNRHCLGIEALPGAEDEPDGAGSPERWLVKLAGWADQRRSGAISGPAVLLIVDDLEAAAKMEYDARVNFDWLIKEGPAVRIWPVVALRTAASREMTRWVRLFKTRLLGPAEDSALFGQLASDQEIHVDPTQFAVRIHNTWLKFRLPILPDEV